MIHPHHIHSNVLSFNYFAGTALPGFDGILKPLLRPEPFRIFHEVRVHTLQDDILLFHLEPVDLQVINVHHLVDCDERRGSQSMGFLDQSMKVGGIGLAQHLSRDFAMSDFRKKRIFPGTASPARRASKRYGRDPNSTLMAC